MMGLDQGPHGTCTSPFCSGKSVGSVNGVGSGDFVPTGIKSIGDVVLLVVFVPRGVPLFVFVPRGVDSKGGQLIELFWRPKY